MARSPCTFKQRDLRAAVKAVLDAGCEVQRVEFDQHGRPVIVTGASAKDVAGGAAAIEQDGKLWDKALSHEDY
jgi:hypothetical protein